MDYSTDYLENILLKYLKLNSNNESNEMCYYRCANKEKLNDLFFQKDHEIIFGRRGTGKTTLLRAFTYFVNSINNNESNKPTCYAIYINMEDVVPDNFEIKTDNNSAYIIETYRKFLKKLFDSFVELWEIISETSYYYNIYYSNDDLNRITNDLALLEKVLIEGTVSPISIVTSSLATKESENAQSNTTGAAIEFALNEKKNLSFFNSLSFGRHRKKTKITKKLISQKNNYSYTLDTAAVREVINKLVEDLNLECLYVCIDEFTFVDKGVEESIQPNIAQMVKDTFFRNQHISVKITSLWSRNEMQSRNVESIKRIGIEVGDDINRGLDLDTIFIKNDYAITFFKTLIANVICLDSNDKNDFIKDYSKSTKKFTEYIINHLFVQNSFRLLVCASQGVPRVFCDVLKNSINLQKKQNQGKITSQMVFESAINHFKQETRKKITNSDPLVVEIDEYVSKTKQRILIMPIDNYNLFKTKINNLVDKNYLHQFPSETIPRRIRNTYKVFFVNYGNYLESVGIKEYQQLTNKDLNIFPNIPKDFIQKPKENCFIFHE